MPPKQTFPSAGSDTVMPIPTFTVATVPDPVAYDGQMIYVEDAPAGDELAIAQNARWHHVTGGNRNWFGPSPYPGYADLVCLFIGDEQPDAVGDPIARLVDQSSFGNNADLGIGGMPIMRSVAMPDGNNHKVWETGPNKIVRTSDLIDDWGATDGMEVMLVMRDPGQANTVLYETMVGGIQSQEPLAMHVSDGSGSIETRGQMLGMSPGVGGGTLTWARVDARFDISVPIRATKRTGAAEASSGAAVAGPFVAHEIVIGGRFDGSFNFVGYWAFFAAWRRILTPTERADARQLVDDLFGVAA